LAVLRPRLDNSQRGPDFAFHEADVISGDIVGFQLVEHIAANSIVGHGCDEGRCAAKLCDGNGDIRGRAAKGREKPLGRFDRRARRLGIKIHAGAAKNEKIMTAKA